MKKTAYLWIALGLALLATGALLATPATAPPATQPSLSPAASAAGGLPPGALPMTLYCSQTTSFCVWAQCSCTDQCIPQHLPGVLTSCSATSQTYTCICQLH